MIGISEDLDQLIQECNVYTHIYMHIPIKGFLNNIPTIFIIRYNGEHLLLVI